MLIKREPPRPDEAPEEILSGVCGTCKRDVTVQRFKATPPPTLRATEREPGTFNDLSSIECPTCRARIYVTRFYLDKN